MNSILRAIEMLGNGQWDAAHQIAQNDETPLGAWLHGILHMIEGDESNARYWYQKAGRPFLGMKSKESEIKAILAQIQ